MFFSVETALWLIPADLCVVLGEEGLLLQRLQLAESLVNGVRVVILVKPHQPFRVLDVSKPRQEEHHNWRKVKRWAQTMQPPQALFRTYVVILQLLSRVWHSVQTKIPHAQKRANARRIIVILLSLPGLCLLQLKKAVGVLYSRLRKPAEFQLERFPLSVVQLLKFGLSCGADLLDFSYSRMH